MKLHTANRRRKRAHGPLILRWDVLNYRIVSYEDNAWSDKQLKAYKEALESMMTDLADDIKTIVGSDGTSYRILTYGQSIGFLPHFSDLRAGQDIATGLDPTEEQT